MKELEGGWEEVRDTDQESLRGIVQELRAVEAVRDELIQDLKIARMERNGLMLSRNFLIRRLLGLGMSMSEVGKLVGLSKQQVFNIKNGRK